MGERFVQFALIVLAVIVGFTVLGWLLRALWWISVVAAGIVVGGLILNRLSKN